MMTRDPSDATGAAGRLAPPPSPVFRRLVDAGAAIRTAPPAEISFLHTVFCQCPLPLRSPGREHRTWIRHQGRTFLRLEAGAALDPRREAFVELGLPYGEMPRLVLVHLTTEAKRTGKPEIEVADSMTAFLRRIGLDDGGRARARAKDQLARLAAATVRLAVAEDDHARHYAARFIAGFDLWFPKHAGQRVLWPSKVELSPEYFASLRDHAVPLDHRAVAALKHSALALDVYSWLAQRLCRVPLRPPVLVSWAQLREQFGPGYRRLGDFRRNFLPVLRRVKEVAYPRAEVEPDGRGLTLRHSPPPVAPRLYPVAPSRPRRL